MSTALLPTRRYQTGFTLIELLVTLVVVSIVLAIAFPAFTAMMQRQQGKTQVNDFIGALSLARSEALKTGRSASVRAADASANLNEFGSGWCVVTGSPANCTGAALRQFPAFNGSERLNSIENAALVTFNGRGELTAGAGLTFDFCVEHLERRVSLSPVGRTRIHTPEDPVVARRPSCA